MVQGLGVLILLHFDLDVVQTEFVVLNVGFCMRTLSSIPTK